jgi:hypothetical protein
MNNQQKKERETIVIAASLLIAVTAMVGVSGGMTSTASAQEIDISQLTPAQIEAVQNMDEIDPVLELEAPPANATDDRQMNIKPDEALPSNGTVTLSMAGAEDVDFKGLVPEGISVVVTNQSVTVTNQPVAQPGVDPAGGNTVPTPASTPEPAAPADESSDDSEEDEE